MSPYPYHATKICMFSIAAVFSGYPLADTRAQGIRNTAETTNIQQRDEIRELQRRIRILEEKLEQPAPSGGATTATRTSTQPAASPAPDQPADQPPDPAPAARPQDGGLQVDEVAAQRALERTLTQTGALLLPRGMIEITPTASYSLDERELSRLAVVSPESGMQSIAPVTYRNRQTRTFAGLGFRIGLPLAMQFEGSLGANRVSVREKNDFGGSRQNDVSGRGDISVALAKTLLKEKGWRPDVVGRVTYNFGSTQRLAGLAQLPGTFRQAQGEFMLLKRQDPIAFTFGTNVVRSFAKDGFRPGDSVLVSVGAALAASPQSSLQMGYLQVKNNMARQAGAKIPGSDQLYGIFTLGVSSVISARQTIITQVGIGLGEDAPKFTVSLSVPIIFP